MSDFDAVDDARIEYSGVVGPPSLIAVASVAVGALSLVVALFASAPRAVQWLGWALGFAAIVTGIAYRWVARSRQMVVLYMSNYLVDRAMLLGVLLGFAGVVWNAFHIAQRVVE